MNTKTISVYRLRSFEEKVSQLNRKAEKLGIDPIVYRIVARHTKKDEQCGNEVFDYYEVKVYSSQSQLPGS